MEASNITCSAGGLTQWRHGMQHSQAFIIIIITVFTKHWWWSRSVLRLTIFWLYISFNYRFFQRRQNLLHRWPGGETWSWRGLDRPGKPLHPSPLHRGLGDLEGHQRLCPTTSPAQHRLLHGGGTVLPSEELPVSIVGMSVTSLPMQESQEWYYRIKCVVPLTV